MHRLGIWRAAAPRGRWLVSTWDMSHSPKSASPEPRRLQLPGWKETLFSQIITKLHFKVITQTPQIHTFAKVGEVSRERRRTISMSFSWPYGDCHDNTASILQTWIYSFALVWLRIIRARFPEPGSHNRTAVHGSGAQVSREAASNLNVKKKTHNTL